ncbi:putative Peflin [Hypsibius exemplaris]|uniref:Peflin n=1 Tax=Hypsibius exemplaris TaxID=2072580 RepID=A0A1W0X826_HYPEX|nr:putative Peflin [Hypsibius exemplaris]
MASDSGRDAMEPPPAYGDIFNGSLAAAEALSTSSRSPTSSHSAARSLRDHRVQPSAPPLIAAESVPEIPPPTFGQSTSGHSSSGRFSNRLANAEPSLNVPSRETREEDQQLMSLFAAVDEDSDGFITVAELQQALINDNWSTFSMNTINVILQIFDKDDNCRIDFDEFSKIKNYVAEWKIIFDRYDTDRSGTIDIREIKSAILAMGFNVSTEFCNKLGWRFCQDSPGKMHLDAFIFICATIHALEKDHRRSTSGVLFVDVLNRWIDQ